ncbi:MAG: bifunctional riboflavin kinase/FAD synthetase [bacterium]
MRVAILGNFDGVHRGHREVIAAARARAGAEGTVVAVTFDPHPIAVLRPGHEPALLTGAARRSQLLLEAGADEVVVLPFTTEFAAQPPADFARLLRDRVGADIVVVGSNFRFGKGAAGNTEILSDLGQDLGFEVDIVDLAGTVDEPWSSTYVRACIAAGDMRGAAQALGRPHRVDGVVRRGDARGRELGYPTANIEADPGLAVPPDGVYAGFLVAGGQRHPAAISVGTNPQFGGRERRVEAYAIGRDDLSLYDEPAGVEFLERLRGQDVFDSVDALVAQMARDVAAAERALSSD